MLKAVYNHAHAAHLILDKMHCPHVCLVAFEAPGVVVCSLLAENLGLQSTHQTGSV